MKPLFTQTSSAGLRLGLLAVLSLVLALMYSRSELLEPAKARLNDMTLPLYWVTDLPGNLERWLSDRFTSKSRLHQENEALRTELLVHKRELQQLAALSAENTRLRQLLNSADQLEDRVLVAELIGISPNPMTHRMIINRGTADGVYEGQPVVDAFGLVGQVVEAGGLSSTVLLITDSTHALPVQVNRNGLRLVAEGEGRLDRLRLRHVSSTMDIRVGDLLVSSGLGQRFPAGYPVGIVERIEHDPGRPFASVQVRPMAELDSNRHMLLVFDRKHELNAVRAEQ